MMLPRKQEARIILELISFLAILFLLRSSFPLVHNDAPALKSCSKDEENYPKTLRTGQETQVTLGTGLDDNHIQQWKNGTKPHRIDDTLSAQEVTTYVRDIMGAGNRTMWRMQCSTPIAARYDSLRATTGTHGRIQYFFAIDLYQSIAVIPTLLGAIIQAIRFLGPGRCAVSIVEGRSTDGTYQVLTALQNEVEKLDAEFYISTSDVSPKDGPQDRFEGLAFLRNLALTPLIMNKVKYSSDAQVIFLNDIYLCPHDILELLYQQKMQNATMTCGMDWAVGGDNFYDIYVARSIVGETFWQVPQDGGWQFSGNLFWADQQTSAKYKSHQPFQVYACWNGGVVISARPILERRIRFRRNVEGECHMGEPTLFAKDLWRLGLGRIQVVPTVNVDYDNRTEEVKDRHGRVEDHLNMTSGALQTEPVHWQKSPPTLVKCMPTFEEHYWVPST